MKTYLLILSLAAAAGCKSTPDAPVAQPPQQAEHAPPVTPATAPEQAPTAAVVITDADAEHRTAPNGKGEIVRLVTGTNAFLGKLSMDPGGEVPLHRDPTEEYIYVLQGSGLMTIDGKEYEIGPNTAIYMPANAEVSFKNGAEQLVALQVFAGPEPAAKYDKWTPAK